MRKRSRQTSVSPALFALRDRFVAISGEIETVAVETNVNPQKIDHVWIEVAAGKHGPLQIALNTRSRKNEIAGFDPRVSLGVMISTWKELPEAGVERIERFDYATIAAAFPVDFIPIDREALEELLMQKAKAACFARGWGEFFVRTHVGIHQVHSRRSSFAYPVNHEGKDGALELYFEDDRRLELLLFKFAGQA